MSHQLQNETIDLANLRLRLRRGLNFELQEQGNIQCYVVHDETSSNYFQIGIPEYAFLSVFDGKTTLQQAVQETALRLGKDALSIRDAVRLAQWLIESGLANAVDESGTPLTNALSLIEKIETQNEQKIVSQLNPLFIRLPLRNLHVLFDALTPIFCWMKSKTFFVIWSFVVAFAMARVFQQPEQLANDALGLLAANAWIWLLLTLAGLKVVHELAHGVFCQSWGGRVKQTGIVFILFIPMPYVDVTSCWSFPSKWKRIAVSAAGMYIEIFLAAVAAILWSYSHDPITKFHLFNVMVLGSLTTVMFNANFLMRFDGYYILSDLIEIPNLYQKGQQFVNMLGRRFLLGTKSASNLNFTASDIWIRLYGIAAFVWRVTVCVSLTVIAAALFYGFGLGLAILGLGIWLGIPIARFWSRCNDPVDNFSPNYAWIGLVSAPAAIAIAFSVFWSPWPVPVSAPAMVEYKDVEFIRADAGGFVESIFVSDGQFVQAGDLLVELENVELKARLRDLQLEREKSFIRSRQFHDQRKLASYQSELASREAIEVQISEIQAQLLSLQLTATQSGVVAGNQLDQLPGQYVSSGASLMQIIKPEQKKITACVEQDHFAAFEASRDQAVHFLPRYSTTKISGFLDSVNPSADTTVDVRLTSITGGDIDVRPPQNLDENPFTDPSNRKVELLAPRFIAEIKPSQPSIQQIHAGVVGEVRLNRFDATVAEHVVTSTRRWLESIKMDVR